MEIETEKKKKTVEEATETEIEIEAEKQRGTEKWRGTEKRRGTTAVVVQLGGGSEVVRAAEGPEMEKRSRSKTREEQRER